MNKICYMNKRGVALEVSAVIIILIATLGVFTVMSYSEHIYIGNKDTQLYYDYKLCPDELNTMKEDSAIMFKTKRDADDAGYAAIEGCVQ